MSPRGQWVLRRVSDGKYYVDSIDVAWSELLALALRMPLALAKRSQRFADVPILVVNAVSRETR